jgi:putative Holliday junction resolvase
VPKISVLGLDIGQKRVGIAGCDGLGLIATGLTTLTRTSFQADVKQLQKLIEEREVELLVVGLPYSMKGNLGFQAQKVQKYAQRLANTLQLPLEYIDERLTSVEAEEQLKAQKRFSTRNKSLIDRQAAEIILQQWLDQRRSSLTTQS